MINMTNVARTQYPQLTLLSNDPVAAYVMDVSPAGGPYFARLNKDMLKTHPECLILWDPFTAHSIFSQTELSKENMLQDSTIRVLEKYDLYQSEYLLLYRNAR